MPKPKDYILRRRVRALTPYYAKASVGTFALNHALPDGWSFENGMLYFNAGTHDSYIVNGKDYNLEGTTTLEDQREAVMRDLQRDGFSEDDAAEFVQTLPDKEGMTRFLSFDGSQKWLALFPHYKTEALETVQAVEKQLLSEAKKETRHGGRRR